jgi:phage-related protein
MNWTIAYFNDALQATLLGLPAKLRARFIHLTERMIAFGPDLGMPHTRAMGTGLFELRVKGREGIMRAFFCVQDNRRILFLHAYVKKSAKTPSKELKIARTRKREVDQNADS